MTVPKAIKILDWWIAQKQKAIKESCSDGKNSEVMTMLNDSENTAISNLKLIREQLIPNYKHPKKMQDICVGVKYCMDCNTDL